MKYKKITLRVASILFCISLCFSVFSCVAFADTGPKPSVRVKLENLHGACYGTLLSEEKSNGPNSAYDPELKYDNKYVGNLDEKTWEAFVNYEDKDGFYFLQVAWNVTETKEISWTYYPPSPFKILLYFPETNTFVSSGIYEKYAFDSYFTVDLNDFDTSDDKGIFAERSYEYKNEILSLVVRIIFTVIIEILLALLFGLRKKKELLFILATNGATQIILNVLLNIVNYRSGQAAFISNYVFLEIVIFALEAVLYCSHFGKIEDIKRKKSFYVLYSLVANVASFFIGLFIAHLIPGIF